MKCIYCGKEITGKHYENEDGDCVCEECGDDNFYWSDNYKMYYLWFDREGNYFEIKEN